MVFVIIVFMIGMNELRKIRMVIGRVSGICSRKVLSLMLIVLMVVMNSCVCV